MKLHRRVLLAGASATLLGSPLAAAAPKSAPYIQTVLGAIAPSELGPTLPHEHVICDFIGANQTNRKRWRVDEVVARMQPVLEQVKDRGITGFVDCTPAFIGRDPRVLVQLARATGLHILTNTGYYGGAGDKFVPSHAYRESADQLASRWTLEIQKGIAGTGVRPGFLKTGVDEIEPGAALSTIDEKLVRAAAQCSRQTGLTVVCHTGGAAAGLAAAKLFLACQGLPERFVVAHADGHGLAANREVAALGAWVSFDHISRRPPSYHLPLVQAMADAFPKHLLLSQDNGWYAVGQPNGGVVRNFNFLSDTFLPAFRQQGASEALVQTLLVENPSRAFAISK